jgi:hypothetical protein
MTGLPPDGAVGASSCPCCGQSTPSEPGAYDICEECGWEDDPVQRADPTLPGANRTTLLHARAMYGDWGVACPHEDVGVGFVPPRCERDVRAMPLGEAVASAFRLDRDATLFGTDADEVLVVPGHLVDARRRQGGSELADVVRVRASIRDALRAGSARTKSEVVAAVAQSLRQARR